MAEEPEFTDIIENVTVPAGRNVRMACSVRNLGTFKVSTKLLGFQIFHSTRVESYKVSNQMQQQNKNSTVLFPKCHF